MRSSDVDRVSRLVAGSFEAHLTPYMTATQSGWEAFARIVVDHPTMFPTQRLVVAEVDGRVVGFADFRTPEPNRGFLSYICVDPGVQRSGVARNLLAHLVRTSPDVLSVGLDVFADNAPALEMYRSSGFREVSTCSWWRAPVASAAADHRLSIEGLPAALAALAAYGFCELRGELDGRPFRCGRIGRRVVRLFGIDELTTELPSAIAVELPEIDEVFTVLPSEDGAPAGFERLVDSIRMESSAVGTLAARP